MPHKDLTEVTRVANYLRSIYGEKTKVSWGKVLEYLGMKLEYSKNGVVKVSMVPYIIKEFPQGIKEMEAMLSADHSFNVREHEKTKKLPKEQAIAFRHSVVQLLLFLCRQGVTFR